jgi:AraC family ethanolamine operon transcriptional activator
MTALATVRHERFEDIDQTNEFVPEHVSESVQLQPSPAVSEYHQIAYPDLVVTKMRDAFPRADGYRIPEGTTGLALPLPGAERAIWCGFEVAHDMLVAQPATHDFFTVLPASGFGVFQIVVDDVLVEQWRLLPPALQNDPDLDSRQLIPLSHQEAAELRQWLDGWFDAPERADSLSRDPMSSAEFREGLLERLAALLQGAEGDARPSLVGRPLERYSLVRQALDLIETNLEGLSGAQDLADELEVNPRRLQYAFGDVLGTSPHQYLLLRKLHAVRRELRGRCRPETTVSRAASRYGFGDLGRFSERYRKFFGELPSETLAQGCRRAAST